MRLAVRVSPGASRPRVGGRRDDALIVAVSSRAVDGAATEAALSAIAEAFGLRPRQVTLVRGARSREKIVDLDVGDDDRARVEHLLTELLDG